MNQHAADILIQALTYVVFILSGLLYAWCAILAFAKLKGHVNEHGWRKGFWIWNEDV